MNISKLDYHKCSYTKERKYFMKNFVVKFGGFVVDIMAIITLIGLIISTVTVTIAQGLWAGLGVLWAGLVSFIFVFFLIYLVMSINDKLYDRNKDNRF